MDQYRRPSAMKCHLAALAAGLILVACGSEDSVDTATESSSAVADQLPILVHTGPLVSGGDAAEILGTLVLEDDCLFIDDSGFRFTIVWPIGTTWDDESQTLALNDGQTVAIGQSISGGGGYSNVEVLETLIAPEATALAAACVDNEFSEVAILNNVDGQITVDSATSESG